jgi:hypothetical protein
MKRKGITLRKANKNTTMLPADAAVQVQVFRDVVAGTIDRFDIEMRVVFNMDETFVLFEYRPLYTANDKGAKSIDVCSLRVPPVIHCERQGSQVYLLTCAHPGLTLNWGAPLHFVLPRPARN